MSRQEPRVSHLSRKITLPIIIIGTLLMMGGSVTIYLLVSRLLTDRLEARCRTIAQAIGYAAETLQQTGELQRIVSATGANRGIAMIVIADSRNNKIIASTNPTWNNLALPASTPSNSTIEMQNAALRTIGIDPLQPPKNLQITSLPLRLRDFKHHSIDLSPAVVVVGIDNTRNRHDVLRITLLTTAGFALSLMTLSAICYIYLRRHVLIPIKEVAERNLGTTPSAAPPLRIDPNDEIGQLDSALASTFATIKKVRSERDQLQHAFDQHVIVAKTDPQGCITYANDLFTQISGYTHEELLGNNHRILNSKYHPREFFVEMYRTITRGKTWRGEIRNLAKDGTTYWVDTTIVPTVNAENKITGYISLRSEITQRKQAEAALSSLNERFQFAARAFGFGIFDWDIPRDELHWDERMFTLFGLDYRTFTPTLDNWLCALAPNELLRAKTAFNAALQKGDSFNTELPVQISPGQTRIIRVSALVLRDPQNAPLRMVGMAFDITESRRASLELQANEAKLRALFELSPIGIALTDFKTGAFIDANPALYSPTGYTREEFLNLSYWDITPRSYDEVEKAQLEELSAHGRYGPYEKEYIRKDGSRYPVILNGVKTVTPDGRELIWSIIEDISERKAAELEILRANQQLADSIERTNQLALKAEMGNMAKSAFVANMSHEIRTPMNGVIGMLNLLRDTPLNDEQRHLIEIASSSGESLLALINDILDFSKIEAGRLELESIDLDLEKLLAETVAPLALRAHEKDLEFTCEIAPDTPLEVQGDPVRLRQIITNLAGNALKFTTKGEISIHVCIEEQGPHDALFRFSVSDTGLGIPDDKIGLLFTKFSQADASTTRHYGGTGLGLAICKELSELMGGAIGVTSMPGHGSEFWFTARLRARPATQSAHPITAAQSTRVLVVDDNSTSRSALVRLLQKSGFECVIAETGNAATTALATAAQQNRPIELALIDQTLPDTTGLALGRTLKLSEKYGSLRRILLFPLGQPITNEELGDAGYSAKLAKPVFARELTHALDAATTGKTLPDPFDTQANTPTTAPLLSTAKLLVIDDNSTNQLVARSILNKLGYTCETADNGFTAIGLLQEKPVDLILMDVQMPGMDGYETTQAIRKGKAGPLAIATPIIAMTANALKGDREQCIAAGMSDYVTKPIDSRELKLTLEKWLPRSNTPNLATPPTQASTPMADDLPALDIPDLRSRLLNDETIIHDLLSSVLASLDRSLDQLLAAIDAQNHTSIKRLAHTFRGAVGNAGARKLAAHLDQLEKSDTPPSALQITSIQTSCAGLKAAITDYLQSSSHP